MLLSIILTSCLLAAATAVGEVGIDLEGEILQIDPMATTAANYIGVTYDLLHGNPDGPRLDNGGADPGIKRNRRVFRLTYEEQKRSPDLRYIVPDQMRFSGAHYCYQSYNEFMYAGSRSYQRKFDVDVSQTVGVDVKGLAKASFSLSAGYSRVDSGSNSFKNVFYETNKRCNYGSAKYQYELAGEKKYPLDEIFVIDSCQLPVKFDTLPYMVFLKKYGTHVIVEATVGTKDVRRKTISAAEAVRYASNEVRVGVSASAGLTIKGIGVSSSRSLDMKTFWSKSKKDQVFKKAGSHFIAGTKEQPEPIKLDLMELHRAYQSRYWKRSDEYVKRFKGCTQEWMDNLDKIYVNMLTALTRYPAFAHATLPKDPVPSIPLTWPQGTWTLPGLMNGACPFSGLSNFNFKKGSWRHYGLPNSYGNTRWWPGGRTPPYPDNWIHHFCTKDVHQADEYSWGWPAGKYCIYRYKNCPPGMKQGDVTFDDRDTPKWNTKKGSKHPLGYYDSHRTKLHYCCSDKGHVNRAIPLPIEEPFMLLKYGSRCQQVENMKVREYWFNLRNQGKPKMWGATPVEIKDDRSVVRYCYYYSDC